MKKLFVVVLTLALAALGPAALAQDAPLRLTLWHSMSEEAGVLMEKFIGEFNDTVGREENIQVTAVFQGTYADATQKLTSILNAGNTGDLPDVMQIDATGKVAYYTSGLMYTVDQAVAADPDYDLSQLSPSALNNWNYLGTQLGLPFATSTTVTYYNKNLFDQAGIAVPATFEQIAAAADKLPRTDANGQPLYVMAGVPNTPTLANWLGQLGSWLVDRENGSIGRATELVCVENGALATFLSQWKGMYEAGALYNSSSGLTEMFVAGQIAMLPTSSSNTASLLAMIGDRFELGVASYPKVTDQCREGATPSGSSLNIFDKGDGKVEAAWTLVKYLTSARVQAEFAAGTGYIPSNQGAVDQESWQALIAQQPLYAAPAQQLNATQADMRSVTVGPSADFYYAIQNHVSDMLENDQTVEETAQMMAEELNGLLDDYNRANPQ